MSMSINTGTTSTTTKDPFAATSAPPPIETECNYINRRGYKEPTNKCNEYNSFGNKHSYKYVCADDETGNQRKKIKKKKWWNKRTCDQDGDIADEETDDDNDTFIDYSCDYDDKDVELVEANCFESANYWEQTSVILRTCIKINNDQNSLYIQCYRTYTITYYYHSLVIYIHSFNL